MTKKDNTIGKEGLDLLKGLINQKITSFRHEEFESDNPVVFMRVGIVADNGFFVLDNRVDWMEDWFSMADYIPHLIFTEVKDEKDIIIPSNPPVEMPAFPIDESVEDILLVQDRIHITKNEKDYQELFSTEGIVLKTKSKQYGFFKEDTWFSEGLLIYKGQHVLEKLPDPKSHWHIFAKPYDAKCHREIISMASGKTIHSEDWEEIGETYRE